MEEIQPNSKNSCVIGKKNEKKTAYETTRILMNKDLEIPSFEVLLADLDKFILELVEDYRAEKIKSWDDLEKMVRAFYTPGQMGNMRLVVPHWQKMVSYANGLTLVHVMCVFMGLYMLPEFLSMAEKQQRMMKWVILFHDVEKEPQDGKRDYIHAFRSAVGAAQTLPNLGFPATTEYDLLIDDWSEFTRSAIVMLEDSSDYTQDNSKLPIIISGIDRMFGNDSPATLIIKTILFHLSIDMGFWPPVTPLTNVEVKRYINKELSLLLLVMHLADGEGWQMFDPENREFGRNDTLRAFEKVDQLI